MSDTYDYSPWLRQLADMAECHNKGLIKPCPKALRRAADALEQKDATITDLVESLDEAKYDEPELRAKLDKQRQRIEQLEALANDAEDILSQGAGQLDHDIHEWRRQYRGLLLAGEGDEAVAVGPNATGANALIVPDTNT